MVIAGGFRPTNHQNNDEISHSEVAVDNHAIYVEYDASNRVLNASKMHDLGRCVAGHTAHAISKDMILFVGGVGNANGIAICITIGLRLSPHI